MPTVVMTKQTMPIITAGNKIGFLRTEKLNPMASASMLVAMESRSSGQPHV